MAKYNPFECCFKCTPPKRYPGCHDHCPEHAEAKVKFEARKALINADREAREYTKYIISKNINDSAKRRKEWQGHRRTHRSD